MGLWADFVAWMMDAAEKRRSRDALTQLSDEQLRDIGLTRADAWREGNRSFWG